MAELVWMYVMRRYYVLTILDIIANYIRNHIRSLLTRDVSKA